MDELTESNLSSKPSQNSEIYRVFNDSFRDRIYQLLYWGYEDARPFLTATIDETAITGHICEAIRSRQNDPTIELDWLNDFSPHDDEPYDTPGRVGRSRFRPDIRIVLLTSDMLGNVWRQQC